METTTLRKKTKQVTVHSSGNESVFIVFEQVTSRPKRVRIAGFSACSDSVSVSWELPLRLVRYM